MHSCSYFTYLCTLYAGGEKAAMVRAADIHTIRGKSRHFYGRDEGPLQGKYFTGQRL